jgi:hypothetical protein
VHPVQLLFSSTWLIAGALVRLMFVGCSPSMLD